MGQIIDIFAIFPHTHPLVMMSSVLPVSHTVRIANEKRANLVLDTESDDFAGGLVSLIADPSLRTAALLVFGVL
jgi:hypothetical protein